MNQLIFIKVLTQKIPLFIKKIILNDNQIVIELTHFNYVLPCFLFFKKHVSLQCSILMDITAVDYPALKNRFYVVYQILSILYNQRFTLKVNIDGFTSIKSLSNIFKSAGWLEREVWDLFGIFFSDHNDMRRILTDYGFQSFPLRKDFPLTGFIELIYSEDLNKIIYVPLELTQEFRFFDFLNSWE
jgi:NADH:ubiquinone oxidoreductase subunit C